MGLFGGCELDGPGFFGAGFAGGTITGGEVVFVGIRCGGFLLGGRTTFRGFGSVGTTIGCSSVVGRGEIRRGFFGVVLHLVQVLFDGGGGAVDFGGDGGVVDFYVLLREDLEEEELFFAVWVFGGDC